jgi:hypothetical protein
MIGSHNARLEIRGTLGDRPGRRPVREIRLLYARLPPDADSVCRADLAHLDAWTSFACGANADVCVW